MNGGDFGNFLKGVFDGIVWVDEFSNSVNFGKGDVEHSSNISESGTALEHTKGDDIGCLVVSVLASDVFFDFISSAIFKVDIDIGHADTFRVEKSFKEKLVTNGVYLGDIKHPREDSTSRRTSSWSNPNAVVFGKVDKVSDNEEVVGKPYAFVFFHETDEIKLCLKSLSVFFGNFFVGFGVETLHKPLLGKFGKVAMGVFSLGKGVNGGVHFLEGEIHIAHFGNTDGVGKAFGDFSKKGGHFFATFEVELVGGIALAGLVFECFVIANGKNNLLQDTIIGREVVAIVGSHKWDVVLSRETHQFLIDDFLFCYAMILKFKKEVVFAKGFFVPFEFFFEFGFIVCEDGGWDFSSKAGREGNKPLGMALEKFMVDAGF